MSQDLNAELIDILLSQGQTIQFGVPMRSHCERRFLSIQILLLRDVDDSGVDPLVPFPTLILVDGDETIFHVTGSITSSLTIQ